MTNNELHDLVTAHELLDALAPDGLKEPASPWLPAEIKISADYVLNNVNDLERLLKLLAKMARTIAQKELDVSLYIGSGGLPATSLVDQWRSGRSDAELLEVVAYYKPST